jgi:hypothetical protein
MSFDLRLLEKSTNLLPPTLLMCLSSVLRVLFVLVSCLLRRYICVLLGSLPVSRMTASLALYSILSRCVRKAGPAASAAFCFRCYAIALSL